MLTLLTVAALSFLLGRLGRVLPPALIRPLLVLGLALGSSKVARLRFRFKDFLPLAAGNLLVSAGCAMAPVFLDALIDQPHREERREKPEPEPGAKEPGCVAFHTTCA
ncbi:MAG: hypothetical protein ACYC6L_06035 [Anaerolineae bacterium]